MAAIAGSDLGLGLCVRCIPGLSQILAGAS